MATFTEVFAQAWRDFNTANIPSTGIYKPSKTLIRAIGPLLDQYISALVSGITPHQAVQVASTGNLTLSGEQTIDGVLTSASDVLVKDNTAGTENGVYTTAAGAWSRRADLDAGAEFPGATVFVQQGTVNQGRSYTCNNATTPTLGVTVITFILTSEVTTELEVISQGAASSGKGPAGDAAGHIDISWLPTLFKFLIDEGLYGLVGDGLRNAVGISDNGEFELVGPWAAKINDLAKRPRPQPVIYLAGDSRSDQCSFGDTITEARGYLWWIGFLTGWKFDFVNANNYGVAGSTTDALQDQVAQLILRPPGIVILIDGTNDRTSTTDVFAAERTIMNLETAEKLLTLVGGHIVIWITDLPRGDGNAGSFSAGLTDNSRRGDHLTVVQWTRERHKNKAVYTADTWPTMCNPTDSLSRGINTIYYDGLHPGPPGGYLIASAIRTVIDDLLPYRNRLPTSLYDRYTAANTRGNLIDNGMMVGTSGTVNSPATGSLADDWTIDCGAGMVATCSKVAVGDGTFLQEISLVGTPSGTSSGAQPALLVNPVSAVIWYPLDTLELTEGDVVEAVCYAAYDGADGSYVGLRGIPLYIEFTAGGVDDFVVGGEPNMANNPGFPNLRLPPLNLTGVQKTPPWTVPASLTAARVAFKMTARGGEAVNATARFGKVGVRKVIDNG